MEKCLGCRYAYPLMKEGLVYCRQQDKEVDSACKEQCPFFKSRYIEYPITVNRIANNFGDDKPLGHEVGELVAVRPCSKDYENKTFIGFLLGDLPMDNSVRYHEDTGELEIVPFRNPAIFVPELKKIIFGAESWWASIESEKDFRQITDRDIKESWYVKLWESMSGEPLPLHTHSVKYIGTENGEDIYREDGGKYYVRRSMGAAAQWLSATKWSGGYEATAPLDEYTELIVLNKKGKTLFKEHIVKRDGVLRAEGDGYSFSEAVEGFASDIRTAHSTLKTHNEWVEWLQKEKPFDFMDYSDNWLYCRAEKIEEVKIENREIFDKKICLVRSIFKHKICDKSWVVYEITDEEGICLSIVGYVFGKE